MSTLSGTDAVAAELPVPAGTGSTMAAARWGGAVLAACALTFIVTIVLYVTVYGQPGGTGAGGEVTVDDRAGHLLANWPLIATLWIVETSAWVLLAVAGFVLQRRAAGGPAWFPASAAWTIVGVGAIIQSLMYAFTLGAYPAAAASVAETPALLEALTGAATFLFNAGNAAVYLGLGGAFLAELSPARVIPKWLAIGGAVVCLGTAGVFVGLLAGYGQMMLAAPGAMLGYLAAIYLGVAIWKRG